MATASQHASSLQQQQQQQAKTCKLKLVVWRRPLTFPDTAEVVDAAMERYYAALFDSANYNGLHCIHILIRECRLICELDFFLVLFDFITASFFCSGRHGC